MQIYQNRCITVLLQHRFLHSNHSYTELHTALSKGPHRCCRRRQVKVKAVLPLLLSYLFLSGSDPSPQKTAFPTHSALKLLLEGKEALKGLNPWVDGSPGQDRAGQPAGPRGERKARKSKEEEVKSPQEAAI